MAHNSTAYDTTYDSAHDPTYDTKHEQETGLLTKCVPSRLKSSRLFSWWLKLTRLFQTLSSIISLATFSSRVYKVYRLVNRIKTERGINSASQAVEGILAAAVLYTIIATLFMCITKKSSGGPKWLRWLWVVLDLLFVAAFIAVAIMTSPQGGQAGPNHCYSSVTAFATGDEDMNEDDDSCKIPWATFILAIISTLLHATTAAFHEAKDYRRQRKQRKQGLVEKAASEARHGRHGHGNHGHGNNDHTNRQGNLA